MNYPKVKSLKNLKAGIVYQTKNYDILHHIEHNRAEKKGYVDKKVTEFENLIKEKVFMNDLQQINVNMSGLIIEGNNRYEALKNKDKWIPFLMYESSKVNNVSNKEILKVLIAYNGVRSNWVQNQVFKTAVSLELPLAVEIVIILDRLYNAYDFMTPKNFQPTKILGILTKRTDFIHGKKITLPLFENLDLVKQIKSNEFEEDLLFATKLMSVLSDSNKCSAEPRTVLERILKAVWSGQVTKTKIYHYALKKGFKFKDKGNADAINERINTYSNASFPRNPITF